MTTDAAGEVPAATSMPVLDELRSGPPTVSVERAAQLLGISRAYAYLRIKTGDLPVIRIGDTRVRVPAVALLRILTGEA
ncbi:helix-turn-helix transcriptional regulator [Mycobacteroides abscessus]|uniref:helix-turn-helix transcriptional regulator n=1 Tax=Mycobacteroides abscessus TaxID=36809 RepID=UPI000C25B91A|nr:helix-turn-helix domain-containing protein [Mycobacteroides abscessus]PVB44646.1 DNA-binding protein [Mycobacteroides abscessus]